MSKQINNPTPYSLREKIYLFLIFISFIAFFITTISQSLWLDETITYWVVKNGFGDLVYRTLHYQGKSPFYLYYFIVWCFIQILGSAEWVLRLPSLFSLILACFFLYKICLILFDREWALYSIIFFICLLQLQSANLGRDARPYGLAVMFSILSIMCFIQWMHDRQTKHQIAYIISTTATCYAHIIFTPILILHLCYYFIFKENNPKVSFRKLVLTFCIIAGFILPIGYHHLIILFGDRKLGSWAPMPGIIDLLNAWFPIKLFLLYVIGAFSISYIVHRKININIENKLCLKRFLFVLIWFFFPALFLFIISKINGASFFVDRYYFWSYPAIAIVIAGLLRMTNYSVLKLSIILLFPTILITTKLVYYPISVVEDWKSATGYINSTNIAEKGPVLIWPGFIDTRNEKLINIINDHEKKDSVLSPLSYYPLKNKKAVLLPWLPDDIDLEAFLSRQHAEFIKEKDEIWLIVRNCLFINNKQKQKKYSSQDVFVDWLKSQDFLLVEKKSFGAIVVSRFIYPHRGYRSQQ